MPSAHPFLDIPLPVTQQQWPDEVVPLVSVICTTYNHENFIRDALEGFLMQETTFRIEILVHDDASTDATAEIVREYQKRYPQLIHAIYQTENQYRQGKKPGRINRERARGVYIAPCEGDDFWLDPHKLHKQVECLESNPDAALCFHAMRYADESGTLGKKAFKGYYDRSCTARELREASVYAHTASQLHRNPPVLSENDPELATVKNGDRVKLSKLGQIGHGIYLPDIQPGGYRQHGGGVYSGTHTAAKQADNLRTLHLLYLYYKRLGKFPDTTRALRRRCVDMALDVQNTGERVGRVSDYLVHRLWQTLCYLARKAKPR